MSSREPERKPIDSDELARTLQHLEGQVIAAYDRAFATEMVLFNLIAELHAQKEFDSRPLIARLQVRVAGVPGARDHSAARDGLRGLIEFLNRRADDADVP